MGCEQNPIPPPEETVLYNDTPDDLESTPVLAPQDILTSAPESIYTPPLGREPPAPMRGGAPGRIELPIDEIVRLYSVEAMSSIQIAQQFGVSDTTIRRRLREAGVQVPNDRIQRETEISDARNRKERAQELGLDENATWREIFYYDDQKERIKVATALGWERNPRISDQIEAVGWDPYPTWRYILTMLLDVPAIARAEEIIESIQRLKREVGHPADSDS